MTDTKLLFHLSDIHFGLEDNHALDWVKREIAERQPDAVAITGDLTMRARQREFDAATAWIKSLEAPVTVEVGNHDLPYFNPSSGSSIPTSASAPYPTRWSARSICPASRSSR